MKTVKDNKENKPMPPTINPHHTTYRLFLEMPEGQTITVGKLGTFLFEKGVYIYVGSARKNMIHRLERHLKKEKPNRWHIDYVRNYSEVFHYETFQDKKECELVLETVRDFDGICPFKKLGSSDCHCFSHLIYCPEFTFADVPICKK
jgi:Uri superfamily endonuclease